MYRTAFLGCGPRAKGHARAYQHVTRGKMVAVCDLNGERLKAFGDEFQIASRYADFGKMVETERPDVVHMVTLPRLRVELLTWAVELKVPAVIVEKPLACDLDELAAIEALGGRGTKIVVNHQLRFHQPFLMLLDDVRAGRIGPLRYLDGSCHSRPTEQGSHVMNLLFALNGNEPPSLIHGGVGGADGLREDYHHPAPDNGWAQITFANGVRASLLCGEGVPLGPHTETIWAHKRAAAYGSAGHVEWWMHAWSRQLYGGGPENGEHLYAEEDTPAQARLTEAVFDWLEDEGKPHPNRLEISLLEARTIMGMYASAIRREPVALPLSGSEPLLPRLRETLAG